MWRKIFIDVIVIFPRNLFGILIFLIILFLLIIISQ